MDANYIEGFVRVPLSQFVSEDDRHAGTSIHISGFEGILQNPKYQVTGHIDQRIQIKLLNILKLTAGEFKGTTSSATVPSIAGQDICCMVNGGVLQAAKKLRGDSFECTIQICCLPPPQSKKLSDGDIFQNVRYFAKQRRYDVAQQWINTLSAPKRRHLTFMFDRPVITDALDRLLCYPGLWAGLQLGNWAKHLAAHIDECIINYLGYISSSYEKIFCGHEDLKHLLDESTVYQLQNLAPAWCKNDRLYIQEAFRQRVIFKYINSQEILTKLERNILSFTGIIPSIQTFHQNMKYITIGVKILEKYIEVKPVAVKKSDITRTKPSLFDNLCRDWVADKAAKSLQIGHEKFTSLDKSDVQRSFAQLLIAALRYFPLLSTEAPLQDFCGEWEAPFISGDYIKLLCQTASQLGFDNEKIRKQAGYININHRQYKKPLARIRWRSGKPPFYSFALLFNQSFTLRLFGKPFESTTVPSPLCIQSDILRAFFGFKGDIEASEVEASEVETPEAQDLDADMDDVEEVVQSGINLNVQRTTARQRPTARKKTTAQQRPTVGQKKIDKSGRLQKRRNRRKATKMDKTDQVDEDEEMDEEMDGEMDEEMDQTGEMDPTDEMNHTAQTTRELQRQQDVIEEPFLPDTAIHRIRPLDLDADEGTVINPNRERKDFRPQKRVKLQRTAGNSNAEPAKKTGNLFNNENPVQSIPQYHFGPSPTEAHIQTAGTEQGTQVPINKHIGIDTAPQETITPAAEPAENLSREGSPDLPPVRWARIDALEDDEDEIT